MNTDKDTLYARWLSGDLSPSEERELKESGALEELESIIEATDQWSLPAYDAEKGFAQFQSGKKPKPTPVRRLNLGWTIGIAAGILILVVAIFWLSGRESHLEAGNATNFAFDFKDRSSILLNDGSSIDYNDNNWLDQRLIRLKGEAFFEVEKGVPFIVETSHGRVEVLGTQFNVRSWGAKLYVECYEGSVRVTIDQQNVVLTAMESVNLINGNLTEKQPINHQQPQWTTGISRFYQEDINEVFNELARQYDIEVTVPALSQTFSGSFNHDNLETALQNICKPMQLSFTFSDNNKKVTINE